jgi:CRP-like cAMP-binding protein
MAYTETDKEFDQFSQIPLVAEMNFNRDELGILMQVVQVKGYAKKEKILLPDNKEITFRFVKSGIIRQFYVYKNRQINVQFAVVNDIVCSYASYMFDGESGYYIESVNEASVFAFDRSSMDTIVLTNPKFLAFGKRIAAEVCEFKSLREKELLNYSGIERLRHFIENQSQLFLSLPQTYIASYLNVTPETFSALKRKMR